VTKEEYKSLSLDDRATTLWDEGVLVETIVYYGYIIQLWSVYSFFVEIYYNPIDKEIVKIEVVEEQGMKKYINGLRLDI
jgi:hypothetical protein